MFSQRAGLGNADELDAATRSIVSALCRILDGLPLAIRARCHRCDVMSPAEILSQLGNRRDLLRSQEPPRWRHGKEAWRQPSSGATIF